MSWLFAAAVMYGAILTVLFFVAMSGIDVWKKRAENATRLLLEARGENLRAVIQENVRPHNYGEFVRTQRINERKSSR